MKSFELSLLLGVCLCATASAGSRIQPFDCHVVLDDKTSYIQSAVTTDAATAIKMVSETKIELRRGVRLAVREVKECVPRVSGRFSNPEMEARRKAREL